MTNSISNLALRCVHDDLGRQNRWSETAQDLYEDYMDFLMAADELDRRRFVAGSRADRMEILRNGLEHD